MSHQVLYISTNIAGTAWLYGSERHATNCPRHMNNIKPHPDDTIEVIAAAAGQSNAEVVPKMRMQLRRRATKTATRSSIVKKAKSKKTKTKTAGID